MVKNKDSKQSEVQDEGKVMIDISFFKHVPPNKYDGSSGPVAKDLERERKELSVSF